MYNKHAYLSLIVYIGSKKKLSFFSIIKSTPNGNVTGGAVNGLNKILEAPVQMSELASELSNNNDNSIWLIKRDLSTVSFQLCFNAFF